MVAEHEVRDAAVVRALLVQPQPRQLLCRRHRQRLELRQGTCTCLGRCGLVQWCFQALRQRCYKSQLRCARRHTLQYEFHRGCCWSCNHAVDWPRAVNPADVENLAAAVLPLTPSCVLDVVMTPRAACDPPGAATALLFAAAPALPPAVAAPFLPPAPAALPPTTLPPAVAALFLPPAPAALPCAVAALFLLPASAALPRALAALFLPPASAALAPAAALVPFLAAAALLPAPFC